MIGQEKNLDMIFAWRMHRSIPRFILIEGKQNSGRLTLAKEIISLIGGTGIISGNKIEDVRDTIINAYSITEPTVFIFRDVYSMSLNAKNALLKVVEEPPNRAYFIMTVEDVSDVPETICSRANIIRMQPYSKDELRQVTEDPLLLKYLDTIGDIQKYQGMDYKAIISRAEQLSLDVLASFKSRSGTKLLKATNQLRAKETETDKVDCDLFLRIFRKNMTTYVIPQSTLRIMHKYTDLYRNRSINKKMNIESMLVRMLKDIKERGYEIIRT